VSGPPRIATSRLAVASDVTTVLSLAAAVCLALTGSYRSVLGGVPLTITWAHALFAAGAIAAIRHAAAPTPSLLVTLGGWVARIRASPALADATLAFWLTRPAVLVVGFFAVATIGVPVAAPQSAVGRYALSQLPVRFDANWYAGIALDGYDWQHQFKTQQNLAFFPAFPMLMRAAGVVTGAFRDGLPHERRLIVLVWCGLVISLAAFFWATWYVARVAHSLGDADRARTTVLLLASYPFALFYSAAYSESLFLLAAVGAWHHMREGQLARSAAWGVLAGLARPPGFLLSIPLGLIALGMRDASTPSRDSRTGRHAPDLRRLAVAAAPGVGMLLFTSYLYSRTGIWFAWARIHGAWGRVFSPEAPSGFATSLSADGLLKLAADNPYNAMNALGLVFALLLVIPVWKRVGPPWAIYVLVSVLLPLLAGGLLSMGRLTSTLFPLFLALAAVVPLRRAPAVLVPFAMLQALFAALFYTWRELF
jgi:hypothetical protein